MDIREHKAAPPPCAAHYSPSCNPLGAPFEGWTREGRWVDSQLLNNRSEVIYVWR